MFYLVTLVRGKFYFQIFGKVGILSFFDLLLRLVNSRDHVCTGTFLQVDHHHVYAMLPGEGGFFFFLEGYVGYIHQSDARFHNEELQVVR